VKSKNSCCNCDTSGHMVVKCPNAIKNDSNLLTNMDKSNSMESNTDFPKTLMLNLNSSLPCLSLVDTNLFYIPARINGHDCEVLIDLGSNATVIDFTKLADFGISQKDVRPWRFRNISMAFGGAAQSTDLATDP